MKESAAATAKPDALIATYFAVLLITHLQKKELANTVKHGNHHVSLTAASHHMHLHFLSPQFSLHKMAEDRSRI
jgi:hypothetical protein